jgi:hypothetical protein
MTTKSVYLGIAAPLTVGAAEQKSTARATVKINLGHVGLEVKIHMSMNHTWRSLLTFVGLGHTPNVAKELAALSGGGAAMESSTVELDVWVLLANAGDRVHNYIHFPIIIFISPINCVLLCS